MIDPLQSFDWSSLYPAYDAQCRGFDEVSRHLSIFDTDRPNSDRSLYYHLIKQFSGEQKTLAAIGLYEAVLYWKLYSQPAARSNIVNWRQKAQEPLLALIRDLPCSLKKSPSEVVGLVKWIGKFQVRAMRSPSALPVRTTFLQFLYPSVVPIFDKMVLQAVGIMDERANQKSTVLQEYLPFAWELADRYAQQISVFTAESPIRVIDMALWVTRRSGGGMSSMS